jgi:hypothetical protein
MGDGGRGGRHVPQQISPQLAIDAAARRHADQQAQGAARVMQKHWEQCRQTGTMPSSGAPGAARHAAAFEATLKTRRQNVYDEYRQRLQAQRVSNAGTGDVFIKHILLYDYI